MEKIKHILAHLGLLVFGCLFAFGVLECAVRLLPASVTHFRRFPIYQPEPDIGFKYKPSQKAVTEAGCYRIDPVTINSQGFRDTEWPSNVNGGVAILGDSMMEAEQVADTETTSALLRGRLGVPVVNAGVMGFGTFAEKATYEKYLRPLKPSVVVLFFYTGNDITDNACAFNRMSDGRVLKVCGRTTDLGYEVEKGFFIQGGAIREFARTTCMSCRYAMQIYADMVSRIKQKESKALATRPFAEVQFDVYKPEMSPDIQDAWKLTERALVGLRDEVEKDGSKFVLVTVPEFARVTTNLQQELKDQVRHGVPSDIDPWKPLQEVEKITQKNNIRLLKLENAFLAYRDQKTLAYPYFSLSCDGHWNPLGHYLASVELSRYLVSEGLIQIKEDTTSFLEKSQQDLKRDPKEILGEQAAEAVYRGGVYTGNSKAATQ